MVKTNANNKRSARTASTGNAATDAQDGGVTPPPTQQPGGSTGLSSALNAANLQQEAPPAPVAQTNVLLDSNKVLDDINALAELLKGYNGDIIAALDDLRASDAITSRRFAYRRLLPAPRRCWLRLASTRLSSRG
jgi:hypothetical protein